MPHDEIVGRFAPVGAQRGERRGVCSGERARLEITEPYQHIKRRRTRYRVVVVAFLFAIGVLTDCFTLQTSNALSIPHSRQQVQKTHLVENKVKHGA